MIPDLDLLDLHLLPADLKEGPVVALSLTATISSVRKGELVLALVGYFIHSDKVVIVVELLNGWEVSVLLFLDWIVRITESVGEFLSLQWNDTFSRRIHRISFLVKQCLLLYDGQLLLACNGS